jgi:response regulator NasT
MKRSLRIAVADDEKEMRDYLRETLSLMGHEVVGTAATGVELVDVCRNHRPELIITDIRMPDMDGIQAAEQLSGDEPIPIILVSAFHDAQTIERAESNQILAYLVKPIKANNLEPAVGIAIRRFEQFQELRNEAASLRQALEDRKVIERAKGLMMKKANLDEQEAFQRLQKLARANQKKLVEMAALFLSIDEAICAPPGTK